uniref:Putative secreted protein n=1 Tax=Ixodes ricinus TaxID=34613 RepID=A0A6B0U1C7_IXORI
MLHVLGARRSRSFPFVALMGLWHYRPPNSLSHPLQSPTKGLTIFGFCPSAVRVHQFRLSQNRPLRRK